MYSHKILSGLTAVTMTAALFPFCGPLSTDAALNAEEVTLMTLSNVYEENISIPEDSFTEFQLSADEGDIVSCKVVSGNSVKVTKEGLITPNSTTWYWNGGFGSTVPSGAEGETVEIEYKTGDSVVRVTTAENTYDVTVHVLDYATVYAEKVINDYFAENITADMTFEEKLDAITRMPATYVYDAHYQGYRDMIIYGGGDCWASCDLIIKECEMLGINARLRNGRNDPGSGSGHRNVLAWDGENYYELEAGYYSTTAPRPYHVTKRSSLFCFKNTTKGLTAYQYDGIEEEGTAIEVPAEYNGKPVEVLGNGLFNNNDFVTEITIPDSVKEIEQYSVFACSALKKISIPASVETIAPGNLIACYGLTDIVLDADNPYFTYDGTALFNADKTELRFVHNTDSYVIPDSVKVIGDESFRYNNDISSVVIPDTVEKIGTAAFHKSQVADITIGSGVTEIGEYAFALDSAMKSIYIPETVTTIGDYAIGYTSSTSSPNKDFIIYGEEGSAAQTYAEANSIRFIAGKPQTIIYGDANCDTQVNMADAVLIMQAVSNPDIYGKGKEAGITEQGEINGDVIGNDGITLLDAQTIQEFTLELCTSLPV